MKSFTGTFIPLNSSIIFFFPVCVCVYIIFLLVFHFLAFFLYDNLESVHLI